MCHKLKLGTDSYRRKWQAINQNKPLLEIMYSVFPYAICNLCAIFSSNGLSWFMFYMRKNYHRKTVCISQRTSLSCPIDLSGEPYLGLCGNLVGISINLGSMEIMAKWMKRKVSKYK